MKEEVAKAIDTFGLQETAKLLPFREDVPQLLKVMDIYCLPSLWEGLPIGLLEAMAMQKAVIATQVDGNQEIVNHETGILIQKQRPDELSGAILKLAGDADYRLKMGLKARSLVESSFSLEQMVAKTEECYEHVLRYKR
jgi:glycosyltransferase involved in cell wall biosynthesis